MIPGTKVPGNERARERFLGGKGLQCLFVLGNEWSREQMFQGTNIADTPQLIVINLSNCTQSEAVGGMPQQCLIIAADNLITCLHSLA